MWDHSPTKPEILRVLVDMETLESKLDTAGDDDAETEATRKALGG
jgi:hypothetical protein